MIGGEAGESECDDDREPGHPVSPGEPVVRVVDDAPDRPRGPEDLRADRVDREARNAIHQSAAVAVDVSAAITDAHVLRNAACAIRTASTGCLVRRSTCRCQRSSAEGLSDAAHVTTVGGTRVEHPSSTWAELGDPEEQLTAHRAR